MSFNNIKTRTQAERGFTIVELLIVIVVIGILAAITIVSFNGVTSKANTSNAASNAEAIQKVAESFNADNSYYPSTNADFTATANTVKLPSGVTVATGVIGTVPTLDATTGKTKIVYRYKGTAGAATGGKIQYFDFGTKNLSGNAIYVGDGKSTDTDASFNTPTA